MELPSTDDRSIQILIYNGQLRLSGHWKMSFIFSKIYPLSRDPQVIWTQSMACPLGVCFKISGVLCSWAEINKFADLEIVLDWSVDKVQSKIGFVRSHPWMTGHFAQSLMCFSGGFRSVLFVSCFKVRCSVIVLFWAIID